MHFVLPDGFSGIIKIVKDSKDGMDIQEQTNIFTYAIPASGQIYVTSLEPFSMWHKETANFQDGEVLKTDTDDNLPDDALALRFMLTGTTNTVTTERYFVGTEKELEKTGQSEK